MISDAASGGTRGCSRWVLDAGGGEGCEAGFDDGGSAVEHEVEVVGAPADEESSVDGEDGGEAQAAGGDVGEVERGECGVECGAGCCESG